MEDAELLDEVNSLLVAVGISSKRISSLDELTRVASSMFVAIFESLFQVRLEGIIRNPYTTMDYVINAQLVVDGLSHQIQMDLQHISGESIVNGDVRALSNLIHILYRCVNMTTNKGPGRSSLNISRDLSLSNSDSISTHESAFLSDDNAGRGPRQSVHKKSGDQIFREEATKAAKLSRKRFSLEAKLEAAKFRRDRINNAKGRKAGVNNTTAFITSKKALQKRWTEDTMREKKSFIARRSNEEQVMLRKVYKGLLKRMHDIKVDDDIECRMRVSQMRDDAKNHIKSLQAVFENRIQILKEQRVNTSSRNDKFTRAFKQMKSNIEKSTNQKQSAKIRDRRSTTLQDRQRQLNNRVDAHRILMSVLSSENWAESLRSPTN